ncbi:MAG: GGDEF domain-containing response regulator [Methylococcaceae bacterium]|nr:MAG: GGDEF domain-containing response regulator [Methylococcaceae bacterium]
MTKPARVLYVDGDLAFALLVQQRLTQAGFQVDHAADAATGLRLVDAAAYDVVLVDHAVPGMDGLAMLRELQTRLHAPAVVLIAEAGNTALAAAALKAGATDYMLKDAGDSYLMLLEAVVDKTARQQRLLRETEQRLHFLAHFDALTGLPNRELFGEHLRQALECAGRHSREVALLSVDLDRFKAVNDSLGYGAGDDLLRQVAQRIRHILGEHRCADADMLARLGGDEFAVILENPSGREAVTEAAKKIVTALASSLRVNDQEVFISPSIGVAFFPRDAGDAEGLIRCADAAMHHAKNCGRNNYQFYTPALRGDARRRMDLDTALRYALEKQQLVLHYQPQYDLTSHRMAGVEALLRWRHPEWGVVSPVEFVPMLEDSGLILAVGEWVLRAALNQLRRWLDMGLPPLRMAVNLSTRQCTPDLLQLVDRALALSNLDGAFLELEITEGTLIQNVDAVFQLLSDLRARHVRVAVDDFGTGYSSMSYLRHLPIDSLKIDRSFVLQMHLEKESAAIVKAIITLAQSLGLRVVAEGVEMEGQLQLLREFGCDEVQGHYLGRPLLPDELAQQLAVQKNAKSARA